MLSGARCILRASHEGGGGASREGRAPGKGPSARSACTVPEPSDRRWSVPSVDLSESVRSRGNEAADRAARRPVAQLFRDPQWTVATCRVDGVTVCLGLAMRLEVDAAVASAPRSAIGAYDGQRIVVSRASEPWPLWYLAVRDASIAELELTNPVAPGPSQTARVRLRLAARPGARPRSPAAARAVVHEPSPVAVVMTIGLPRQEEDAFWRCMVTDDPPDDWTTVYRRLLECASGHRRWRSALRE
jgi:hypothetical protein